MKTGKLTTIACAVILSGCARYENPRGKNPLKMDRPAAGIESLENASRLAPTDAAFKVDYLLKRDDSVRDVLSLAYNFRAEGKLTEAQAAYETALKMDR